MAVDGPRTQTRLTDLVAEELRALLARRRISGRELARQMGESASWVNYRLTGHTPIGLDDMQRFADALDVGIVDLLPPHTRRSIITPSLRVPRRRATSTVRPVASRPATAPRHATTRPATAGRAVRLPVA